MATGGVAWLPPAPTPPSTVRWWLSRLSDGSIVIHSIIMINGRGGSTCQTWGPAAKWSGDERHSMAASGYDTTTPVRAGEPAIRIEL